MSREGLWLKSGPFSLHIQSRERAVSHAIACLYRDHALSASDFADFHVEIARAAGVRRWLKPQIQFHLDGRTPFKPLPHAQSFAMLEWGLNWCIATYCQQFLVIHAAVVERNGMAAILPAPPGSGKSTLTAALIQRGWRLCSDELTLIDPGTGKVVALARPVNLKNDSIDIIRAFEPTAVFGPEYPDTHKGRVAHLRPPRQSVERASEAAKPRWVVFPQWAAGEPLNLTALQRSAAFIQLAENAFNYNMLGETGFRTLADTIDRCDCLALRYSRLDDAIRAFDGLADEAMA
ncbi:HprK-related kinase A [Niveibacterium umoris]|uniref:HprK-related kinase A n=1 Tax=Niveibacterium umoris TaxID=1193620 RepID=UPI0023EAE264|nr:HprK-related kinase A [Niveibacterium umoris]